MTKAFKDKKTVFHGVKNSDGKKPNLEDPKYADAPFVDPDDGKTLEDVKKKFAPNADKPTSASAERGQQKLPEIMQKIDPQKKAQIISEMYKQMMNLRNVLNAGAASAGGAAGGQNLQGTSAQGNAVVNPILEDALTGAFVNISKRFGFEYVITVILAMLFNNGIDNIAAIYRTLVINSIINFIKMAIYYGPNNIPVSTYPLVPLPTKATTPAKVIDYTLVPTLYVRQWYALETNPYPAFIEWESPDGTIKIYTKNTSKYYFDSSNEEIFYITETGLTTDLLPYFEARTLTATVLNAILYKYAIIIEQYNIDISLGNGTGSGITQDQGGGSGGGGGGGQGIGQMMGMLQGMLGGELKSHMQNILQKQLSKSVNDKQKVNKNIQLTTQDMANNKKGFDAVMKMFEMGSSGMLGGMNIQSMLSGLTSGGGLNAGGGSSGGGGGGAGSGIPSGQGSYTGGNISTTGLEQIKTLLKILGMT